MLEEENKSILWTALVLMTVFKLHRLTFSALKSRKHSQSAVSLFLGLISAR